MSEPHKNRSICVHWQINYVKIIQMMAWEHFILPLSTMYETYFLNCSLPYFTEFVIVNNIICNWHTRGNASTAHSLLVVMTAFARTRQRQGKDQLKKLATFKLWKKELHPFVHSQRDIQVPINFLSDPHTNGIQVPGWKGAVLWDTKGWEIRLLGCTMALMMLLCVVLVWSSDSQKYLV